MAAEFLPAGTKPADFLTHYATRFEAVEIDGSFYRIPNESTVDGWRDKTPEGFRFTLKASQRITHFDRLRLPSAALDAMLAACSRLGDRLGRVLYQLPPNYGKGHDAPGAVPRANAPGHARRVRVSPPVLAR